MLIYINQQSSTHINSHQQELTFKAKLLKIFSLSSCKHVNIYESTIKICFNQVYDQSEKYIHYKFFYRITLPFF